MIYPNTARLLVRAADEEHAADLAEEQITSASYRVSLPRRRPAVQQVSVDTFRVVVRYAVDVPQIRSRRRAR